MKRLFTITTREIDYDKVFYKHIHCNEFIKNAILVNTYYDKELKLFLYTWRITQYTEEDDIDNADQPE